MCTHQKYMVYTFSTLTYRSVSTIILSQPSLFLTLKNWRLMRTEEPGGVHRVNTVRHNWSDLAHTHEDSLWWLSRALAPLTLQSLGIHLYFLHLNFANSGNFLTVQWLGLLAFMARGAWVWSLFGELRPYKLHGTANKIKKLKNKFYKLTSPPPPQSPCLGCCLWFQPLPSQSTLKVIRGLTTPVQNFESFSPFILLLNLNSLSWHSKLFIIYPLISPAQITYSHPHLFIRTINVVYFPL